MVCEEKICAYAAIILHDCGKPITVESITAVAKSVGVTVSAFWANVFVKALETTSVEALIANVGTAAPAASGAVAAAPAAAAAEEKKEEEKKEEEEEEEEDGDFGLDLFG